MTRHALAWLVAALALGASGSGVQTAAVLRTSDVALAFEAGASAPRVVTLKPAGQAAWNNSAPATLAATAERDGRTMDLVWELDASASVIDERQVTFVYRTTMPRLQLIWTWVARAGYGPVEHTIRIENQDASEVWLPLQDSWQFDWRVDPQTRLLHFFVEKGGGRPSDDGTHSYPLPPGYAWTGASSTYAHPAAGEDREIIPWFLVQNRSETGGSGWYVGLEFSGRTHMTLTRDGASVRGRTGLNPEPGPYRTRLEPGQTFETPTVFVGAFSGGTDAAGNVLRRWVREVLTNPLTWKKPTYPMLVNNTWGVGLNIEEARAHRMIADAAELGVEMFQLDAGWARGVGDWYPNKSRFPSGLADLANDAHRRGLKFGLWVDWTQAGLDTTEGAINVRDPKVRNWLIADVPPDWAPESFKGQTIDIGYPPAREWAADEVRRLVTDYRLDMLEHDGYLVAQGCLRADHPHAPADPAATRVYEDLDTTFVDGPNSTDVSYHAVRAYYGIHDALRRLFPDLLLEVCNDGGRMVDFGSAAHADYFSITDTYDPLSNRQAFYDASHVLPPAMLEAYIEDWPAPRLEHFKYMLRSGMMGWATIMLDTTLWSEEQRLVAREEFAMYKNELRAFIRTADLYHVTERPDGLHWDGIEYFDPQRRKGVVYVFRGATEREPQHTMLLKGLRPDKRYRLRFRDRSSPDRTVSGRELLETGLTVRLGLPYSSELVFITESGVQ